MISGPLFLNLSLLPFLRNHGESYHLWGWVYCGRQNENVTRKSHKKASRGQLKVGYVPLTDGMKYILLHFVESIITEGVTKTLLISSSTETLVTEAYYKLCKRNCEPPYKLRPVYKSNQVVLLELMDSAADKLCLAAITKTLFDKMAKHAFIAIVLRLFSCYEIFHSHA